MVTVLSSNGVVSVSGARSESSGLWIPLSELAQLRWELRPEDACRGDICVPIPKARERDFVRDDSTAGRFFNLTEFARLRRQPVARSERGDVFAIGEASDDRAALLRGGEAPDFALPDLAGRIHSLSEHRGKKVFLVSWASW
jgi:hypothetical protein